MRTVGRPWLPFLMVLATIPLLLAATCGGGEDAEAPASIIDSSATATDTGGGEASPTGPGETSSSVPADRDVEVLDFGFTALRGGLSGGFIAHNKSQTEAVEVPFSILDDAGIDVSGAHGAVVLMPGETHGVAFSGTYPSEDSIDGITVELTLDAARWTAVSSTDSLITTITSTETQFVNGTVANPFSIETGGLWLHTIAYNAADQIIGGLTVGLESVPANGSADFRAQAPFVGDDFANNARMEAYAEFQNSLPPGLAR